jgi:mRNA interferase MazF
MDVKRGEVYLIDLEPTKDSEQRKVRPCLVIQNDIGNNNSPVTIIATITSKAKEYPFVVKLKKGEANFPKESYIQLNHIRTISTQRIVSKIGSIKKESLEKVNNAIKVSLGLE